MEKFVKSEDETAGREVVSEPKIEEIKTPETADLINLEVDENVEKERREMDARRIKEIRESINEKKGWKALLKPQSEWDEEYRVKTTKFKNEIDYYHEKYSGDPLSYLKRWIRSFSREERNKKLVNEKIKVDFAEQQKKFPHGKNLIYRAGSGVVGAVAEDSFIHAPGFINCSGLVFQAKNKVAVIHFSPRIMNEIGSYGENNMNDINIHGHIRSALKQLISDSDKGKTGAESSLSDEEIKMAQALIDSGELKSTMLVGDADGVTGLVSDLSTSGTSVNLPLIKVNSHYIGTAGFTIHTTPEKIFIEKPGVLMEDGVNIPPLMFDYKAV